MDSFFSTFTAQFFNYTYLDGTNGDNAALRTLGETQTIFDFVMSEVNLQNS